MKPSKYIETYDDKIHDYYDLMNIIQGKGDYEDIRNDYIFRGLSNIKHDLVPSSLRKNTKINEYIGNDFKFQRIMSVDEAIEKGIIKEKEAFDNAKWIAPTFDKNGNIIKGKGYSIINSDDELQFKRELYVLLKFLDFSDRNGLKVTADYKVREHIHNYFHFKSEFWPRMEFIEIISLAQHYGVPTKVLDWTYDYKVALYFALKDILDSTKENADGVLWAFNYKLFENNPLDKDMYFNKLHFYRPEYDNNPNLRAQRGLFSFLIDDVHNQNNLSLEKIVKNELESEKEYKGLKWADYKQPRILPPRIEIDKPIFYKFIIPKNIKAKMLKELYSEGYSEEFLFPGYDGVKLAMKNSAILENKLKEEH